VGAPGRAGWIHHDGRRRARPGGDYRRRHAARASGAATCHRGSRRRTIETTTSQSSSPSPRYRWVHRRGCELNRCALIIPSAASNPEPAAGAVTIYEPNVVVGVDSDEAREAMEELYAPYPLRQSAAGDGHRVIRAQSTRQRDAGLTVHEPGRRIANGSGRRNCAPGWPRPADDPGVSSRPGIGSCSLGDVKALELARGRHGTGAQRPKRRTSIKTALPPGDRRAGDDLGAAEVAWARLRLTDDMGSPAIP
jgi:hypothetical protein